MGQTNQQIRKARFRITQNKRKRDTEFRRMGSLDDFRGMERHLKQIGTQDYDVEQTANMS